MPIIGCGGISNGRDAYERLRAGASLVQIYTAFSYDGPPLIKRINREIEELLVKDGFSSVQDIVGVDSERADRNSSETNSQLLGDIRSHALPQTIAPR